MDFITNFSDIAPNTEIGQGLRARCPARGSALASKGLGLSDWLHQVLTSVPRADSAAQLQTLSYVADFTVTRNIGGGLTFKTTIASLGLNEAQINRQRQNKIDVFVKVETVPAATPRGRTPVSESVVNELRRLQSEEREEDRTVIQVEPGQIVTVQ